MSEFLISKDLARQIAQGIFDQLMQDIKREEHKHNSDELESEERRAA